VVVVDVGLELGVLLGGEVARLVGTLFPALHLVVGAGGVGGAVLALATWARGGDFPPLHAVDGGDLFEEAFAKSE